MGQRVSPARVAGIVVVVVLALLALPSFASAHDERPSYFPNFDAVAKKYFAAFGNVPAYRNRGPALIVCKRDSLARIRALPARTRAQRAIKARNLVYLRACRFRHIQSAVTAAQSNMRILVLPGVYREEPSRAAPNPDPRCQQYLVEDAKGGSQVPGYEYNVNCPNAQNLIAITGDGSDADRRCDHRCNLQISGTAYRDSVLISSERSKLNVIRADRADGIYLSNFTIEFSDFNNIYVLETNGFHLNQIQTRYSREYGVLSFASDNGLYENIDAYNAGDSGIYPGSGPEGHCQRYGIEIRN
ncbi:MAG: right-handed parallel beta-helix repeat-containing protein, partial [Solirubrobacteraceae bacterium]